MFRQSKISLAFAVVLGASAPLVSAISAASVAHAAGGVYDLGGVVVRPSPNVDRNPRGARTSGRPAASYAQAPVNNGGGATYDLGGVVVRPSPNVNRNPRTAGTSERAAASYAQAPMSNGGGATYDLGGVVVRPSPNVDPRTTTRAPTAFENKWFDYQNHDDQ